MARLLDQPVLNGYSLSVARVSDYSVTPEVIGAPVRLSGGSMREMAQEWGDGLPDRLVRYAFAVRWEWLRTAGSIVDCIRSRPGNRTWCDWRRVTISYTGNGSRTEWTLPWPLATEELADPPSSPAGEIDPQATTDPADFSVLTVIPQDSATYAAGSPSAGEVWIDSESRLVKVESLAAGTVLYLRFVPLFLVVETSADPSKPNFATDPISLRFAEADW